MGPRFERAIEGEAATAPWYPESERITSGRTGHAGSRQHRRDTGEQLSPAIAGRTAPEPAA